MVHEQLIKTIRKKVVERFQSGPTLLAVMHSIGMLMKAKKSGIDDISDVLDSHFFCLSHNKTESGEEEIKTELVISGPYFYIFPGECDKRWMIIRVNKLVDGKKVDGDYGLLLTDGLRKHISLVKSSVFEIIPEQYKFNIGF